jgi:hypothetical protein
MNKKVLVIALASIFSAMLVAPVMAASTTKIEGVTLTLDITIIPDPDSIHTADHNIVHNKGIATGTATLNIPGQDSLNFTYYGTWSGTSKWTGFPTTPDLEGSNVVIGKSVLTSTDEGTTGTFEGVSHSKTIGLPPVIPIMSYTEYHMVFRGTEDFKGQTLKVSYAGAPPAVLEGTLIIPK